MFQRSSSQNGIPSGVTTVLILFFLVSSSIAQVVGGGGLPVGGSTFGPTILNQYEADQVTGVPVGGSPIGSTIVFKGQAAPVINPGGGFSLCVEIQPVGWFFSGIATSVSTPIQPGETAIVTLIDIAPGQWRWQAWWIDVYGNAGPAMSFPQPNPNPESVADFTIDGANGYSTGFDHLGGWWISSTSGKTGWSTDGVLQYNNGIDYDTPGTPNAGGAVSPPILIPLTNPVLQFWCMYGTETTGTEVDQRWVRVWTLDIDIMTVHMDERLSTLSGGCDSMGAWHPHSFSVDTGGQEVSIEFYFDTVDANDNNHPGWFIDDLYFGAAAPPGGDGGVNLADLDDNAENEGNPLLCGAAINAGRAAGLWIVLFVLGVSVVYTLIIRRQRYKKGV
jgi:hypothetical protein